MYEINIGDHVVLNNDYDGKVGVVVDIKEDGYWSTAKVEWDDTYGEILRICDLIPV